MKISVETKVAASVAAAFIALTVGVIAQGSSEEQSADTNGYAPTKNVQVTTDLNQCGYIAQ